MSVLRRARTLPSQLQKLTLNELRKDPSCKPILYSIHDMVHPQNTTPQEISTEQVNKLCKLARLGVPKDEAFLKLKKDLNEVISCLHQLPQDINPNVVPTYSPLQLYNRQNHMAQRWRSDAVEEKVDTKAIVKHAPFLKANCYHVIHKNSSASEEEF